MRWPRLGSVVLLRVSKARIQGVTTLSPAVDLSHGIAVDADNVFAAGPAGVRMYAHYGRNEVIITASPSTEVAVQGDKVFTCLFGEKTELLQFPRVAAQPSVQIVKDTKHCESIAPDKGFLVFGGDLIYRVAITAAEKKPEEVKLVDTRARRLAIDDPWVYSIVSGSAEVSRNKLDGSTKGGGAFATGPATVEEGDIALDDEYVYWTTGTPQGGVYRVLKENGANPERIAEGERRPRGITVDNDAVYWANYDTGEIRKRAKP